MLILLTAVINPGQRRSFGTAPYDTRGRAYAEQRFLLPREINEKVVTLVGVTQ